MSLRSQGEKSLKKYSSNTPLWKGPEKDGITFSMLCTFLICPERFRIKYILGLNTHKKFIGRIEFGHMWHGCEELESVKGDWLSWAVQYAMDLCKKYPLEQKEIMKWLNVCKVQFPIYCKYWANHQDKVKRKPIVDEHVFNVQYPLPSGRVVRLRGKFDGVDFIPTGKNKGVWLQENKTKGIVNEVDLLSQLKFDMQTGMYMTALEQVLDEMHELGQLDRMVTDPIRGIRYNVIRRPLSGGAGSIRRKKPTKTNPDGESLEEFYQRLKVIIEESQDTYFYRWNVHWGQKDTTRFRERFLDPILDRLCTWYDHICANFKDPFSNNEEGIHSVTPYGFYNVLSEGGKTDLDSYILDGNIAGLQKSEKLFEELEA